MISVEGTLIDITCSCIIAGIYAIGRGWEINFFLIVISGTISNLTDSILGALFERKGVIGNDMVNFLNGHVAVGSTSFLICLPNYSPIGSEFLRKL